MKIFRYMVIPAVLSALLLSSCSSDNDNSNKDTPSTAPETTAVQQEDKASSTEASADAPESDAEEPPVKIEKKKPQIDESVTDLYLSVDKRQICIGEDDPEIIFVARDIEEKHEVELVDEDTGEVVAQMLDDAEFEISGDDIMGDCWYSVRYKVDDTYPTDPDVSEDREYRYYARFIDGTTEHRSKAVEIEVYETFTDSELDKMQEADDKIKELMNSDGFSELELEEKKEKLLTLLHELEEKGIVDKGSIYDIDDHVAYSSCGIPSHIILSPMPWQDGTLDGVIDPSMAIN